MYISSGWVKNKTNKTSHGQEAIQVLKIEN